jgi:hypothetical protein
VREVQRVEKLTKCPLSDQENRINRLSLRFRLNVPFPRIILVRLHDYHMLPILPACITLAQGTLLHGLTGTPTRYAHRPACARPELRLDAHGSLSESGFKPVDS